MALVVVGIISKKNNNNDISYLLVSSKKDFGEFTGYYYPPGGHKEDGESDINGLRRELEEELNMELLNANKIAETESDVKNQITAWYRCDVKNHTFSINHAELLDAKYFTREEMKNIKIWPATKRFFEEYIFKKKSG